MEVRQLIREFHFNGVTLPEINSTMTVEDGQGCVYTSVPKNSHGCD
jgi:hypothetical protein